MKRTNLGREDAVASANGYAVELLVEFDRGAGLTSSISAERIGFTTDISLAVADRLIGSLRFPPSADDLGTVLRFVARVTEVHRLGEDDGPWEVTASFEALSFALDHTP